MIFTTDLNQSSYIICLDGMTDKETLMKRAMVKPKTYAGDLIENIYDAIFRLSVELKRQYKQYYSIEYATFGDYSRKHLLFTQEMSNKLNDLYARCSYIYNFHSCYCFLEEEYGRDFLEKLLEPRMK